MLERIISGGQTGVDRVALDVALQLGMPCGGWCPRGRLAEDGPIPARYPLREAPTSEYAERTAWNVRDSDATLVITWGPPTEGTAYTVHIAESLAKPCHVVDLARNEPPGPEVLRWIEENHVRVLNVAGPRASRWPDANTQQFRR